MQSDYNFTDDDIIVIVSASSKFLKKYVSQRDFYSSDTYPVYPLNCTADPWETEYDSYSAALGEEDEEEAELQMTEAEPGSAGGANCSCVDYYFEDEEKLEQLM